MGHGGNSIFVDKRGRADLSQRSKHVPSPHNKRWPYKVCSTLFDLDYRLPNTAGSTPWPQQHRYKGGWRHVSTGRPFPFLLPVPIIPPSSSPPLTILTPVRLVDMYRTRSTRLSSSLWQRSVGKDQYQRDETDYSEESDRDYDEKAYDELYEAEYVAFKVSSPLFSSSHRRRLKLPHNKVGQRVWIRLQETWYRGQVKRIVETEQSQVGIN